MIKEYSAQRSFVVLVSVLCLIGMSATTLHAKKPPERYRLYTKPDPEAKGGIKGEIASPSKEIHQILATPPDEPRLVYKGELSNTRRAFEFVGLPMRKYDLIVIYERTIYEGLQLNRREQSTLTPLDLKKIKYQIDKSEPYFTKKIIYRVEGITGRGNECRLIASFLRDRSSANSQGGGMRRTFKVVIMKDVGPGWQVVRARDLYPSWVEPKNVIAKHNYSKALSNIRVTSKIKDVGRLYLTK